MNGYRRDRFNGASPAKLIVINRCKDRWILAANRTLRVAPQIKLPKLDLERVEVDEASYQGLSDADDELDRLNRLEAPNNSGQHAHHARLRAVRTRVRWRRLPKKAAVAWPAQRRRERGGLSFETKYRAVHIWLLIENTNVIGEITRGKIIRSVH